jgi:hypothetical protein
MSVLRSAYKHWYYKEQLYKIDAIQKERHGIGIPVIKLPVGYSQSDKTVANDLGRNLRTNERAHVVLPPNWDLSFAELKGQPVDVIKSIEHHDSLIEKNVMGSFVSATNATDENHDMFLKSARFIADIITETWNKYAIKQLVDYNWTNVEYPKLRARRIGEQSDWRTVSFALRNLIGAGVIVPDDPLEDSARDLMDLPRRDPKTARLVRGVLNRQEQQPPPTETGPVGAGGLAGKQEAVQNAAAQAGLQLPQVGTPRQSKQPPVGVPSPSAGRDGSGIR